MLHPLCHPFGVCAFFERIPGVARALRAPTPAIYVSPLRGFARVRWCSAKPRRGFAGERWCSEKPRRSFAGERWCSEKPRMGRHIYSRGWSMRSMRNPRKSFEERSNPEGVTQRVTTGVSISPGQLCHPFGVRSFFKRNPGVARALRAHPRLFMCRPIRGFFGRAVV